MHVAELKQLIIIAGWVTTHINWHFLHTVANLRERLRLDPQSGQGLGINYGCVQGVQCTSEYMTGLYCSVDVTVPAYAARFVESSTGPSYLVSRN